MDDTALIIQSMKVRRIKLLSFTIDEHDIPVGEHFYTVFNQSTDLNIDQNLVIVTFRVIYNLPAEPKPRPVLTCIIMNAFEIPNLKNFVKGVNIGLPGDILVTMASLCISHARAIIANQSAGTVFGDSLLPILNPLDVAKNIFPGAFDDIHVVQPENKPKKKTKKQNS